MRENSSPWIHQLNKERATQKITQDIATDISIVGGGIAGVATAFFVLKYTDKHVVLCERGKIGHGATGHNAGQIVSYFERPFKDLVGEFGLEMASQGQKDVEDAWQLLDEMYADAGLNVPVSRFQGHLGLHTKEQLVSYLEDMRLRVQGGLSKEKMRVARELSDVYRGVLKDFEGMYDYVPHKEILDLLETENNEFIASLSFSKGVTNSALFVQEVAQYLQKRYEGRFMLFEHTNISKIVLKGMRSVLDTETHTVTTDKIILCTNGFEGFSIFTEHGLELNKKFHARVYSQVAYMSGYIENLTHSPTAISYLTNDIPSAEAEYNYLTRRPFEIEKDVQHNLVCVGGPTSPLYDESAYTENDEYPERAIEDIDNFLRSTYKYCEGKSPEYKFTWHGLMGYTKNYVRMIGPDPSHPELLYNLGCNGVGILPSLCGAKKISDGLLGKPSVPSMFDVRI
ncbi:MAG: FAD-binding oxidoreductase [Minisyncoccia bacterium]